MEKSFVIVVIKKCEIKANYQFEFSFLGAKPNEKRGNCKVSNCICVYSYCIYTYISYICTSHVVNSYRGTQPVIARVQITN